MTSKYAPNGVALTGTPLARLIQATPRDAADAVVLAGDLRDVLASIGEVAPVGLSREPGDKHRIDAAELRAICSRAVREPEPEPVPELPATVTVEIAADEVFAGEVLPEFAPKPKPEVKAAPPKPLTRRGGRK